MFRIIRFGIEVASVRNRAVPMRDGPFAQQASWRVHEYSCWHPAPFLRNHTWRRVSRPHTAACRGCDVRRIIAVRDVLLWRPPSLLSRKRLHGSLRASDKLLLSGWVPAHRVLRLVSPRLERAATIVMVVCAVLIAGAVVRRELIAPATAAGGLRVTTQRNWREFADAGHVIGPADAMVTIVEFSDFQCPFCSRFVALHDSLLSEGLRVRVLYRHFPIPNHPHARNAAIASECAAAQDQFEAMHRTMFGLADSLGTLSWSSLASRAGVPDSAAFVRCLESPESAAAISRDSVAVYKLGLRGTPTLLIGSTRVDGLPLLDSLRVYVKRASTDAP